MVDVNVGRVNEHAVLYTIPDRIGPEQGSPRIVSVTQHGRHMHLRSSQQRAPER
jgi:hypothetical protein